MTPLSSSPTAGAGPRLQPTRAPAGVDPDPEADVRAALAAADVRGALTLLMQRHGDAVYHFCVRMVGVTAADDVHQQVFVDAYRGLPDFDGRSRVRTWLFAIARRRCIDAQRGRTRRLLRDSDDPDELAQVADRRPDAAAGLDEVRALAALGACIDRLAPASREAVLLRYQEGLPYDELALHFDEAAGTICRRVARALVALRTCVERKLGRAGGAP